MARTRRSRRKAKKNLLITLGFWLYLFILWLEAKYFPNAKSVLFLYIPLFITLGIYGVIYILAKFLERKRYLNSSLPMIDKMSGIEFEKFLKSHFEAQGYKVKMTPATNDYGVDLILEKSGEKTAVQAKRYKGRVSNSAVQEVCAGLNYYSCNKGMVITNSYFSKNARALAEKNNIELWDRDFLLENFKIKN